MLIVEDDTSDGLPLPRSDGQDDIPLILQDRRFQDDGSFFHFPEPFNAATDPALRKGGHFLVNGVETPMLEVGAQVVRPRVLNASNSRIYNLGRMSCRSAPRRLCASSSVFSTTRTR